MAAGLDHSPLFAIQMSADLLLPALTAMFLDRTTDPAALYLADEMAAALVQGERGETGEVAALAARE